MTAIDLTIPISEETIRALHAGDEVRLSGVIVTGRDAAHEYMIDTFIRPTAVPESERQLCQELRRLLNRLPELDDRCRAEIRQSFDRLINKLLHPPLESLRHESRHGIPPALLDALAKLFQLKD